MPAQDVLLPAATVLLVRDAPRLEVMMVERHHQIDFASGALVFPGGKTAPGDDPSLWEGRLEGGAGSDPAIAALMIAAIREAFEESGLLLARPRGARASGPLAHADGFAITLERRAAIAAGQADFREAIERDDLVLALDQLAHYAHWVTPKGMPKRFDTRFFIAAAPPGQVAESDGREAVDACWIAPADALAAAASGARKVIFPTRMNLQMLAASDTAADAIAAARARPHVRVEPQIVDRAGVQTLTLPEDAGYGPIAIPLDQAL